MTATRTETVAIIHTTTLIYPVVESVTENSVDLFWRDEEGKDRIYTFKRSAIKGQAEWAARKLVLEGALVPTYGTSERKEWAISLRAEADRLARA